MDSTTATTTTICDLISRPEAERIVDAHIAHKTRGRKCWKPSTSPTHVGGYCRVSTRKIPIPGTDRKRRKMNVYLHHLTLIAAGRAHELRRLYKRGYQVSHLCHKTWCFNPEHLVVESARRNNARNSCKGNYVISHGDMTWNPCPHGRSHITLAGSIACCARSAWMMDTIIASSICVNNFGS